MRGELITADEWFAGGTRRGYDPATGALSEAAFLHNTAGFVDEHQANAERWDLARPHHALFDTVAFHIASADPIPQTRTASDVAGVMTPADHRVLDQA